MTLTGYYNYMWTSQQADASRTTSDESIFSDLHPTLRLELQIALNRTLIENIPMFRMISDEDCPDCLIELIEKLVQKIFIPGEYIMLEGEVGDSMIILVHGIAQVVTRESGIVATRASLPSPRELLSLSSASITLAPAVLADRRARPDFPSPPYPGWETGRSSASAPS